MVWLSKTCSNLLLNNLQINQFLLRNIFIGCTYFSTTAIQIVDNVRLPLFALIIFANWAPLIELQ